MCENYTHTPMLPEIVTAVLGCFVNISYVALVRLKDPLEQSISGLV